MRIDVSIFPCCMPVYVVCVSVSQSTYVTRHKKIGLMCTQNLTTFSNFKHINKPGNIINFPPFMQNFIGNLMQFTKFQYLKQQRRYVQ